MTIRNITFQCAEMKIKIFVFECAQTIKSEICNYLFSEHILHNISCFARSLLFFWDSLTSNMNVHTGKATDFTMLMALWLNCRNTHMQVHDHRHLCAHTHIGLLCVSSIALLPVHQSTVQSVDKGCNLWNYSIMIISHTAITLNHRDVSAV